MLHPKIFFYFVGMALTTQPISFAICEGERAARDNAKQEFERFARTSIGGADLGGFLLPEAEEIIFLALAPIPAYDLDHIFQEKEKALRDCEEAHRRIQELAQHQEHEKQVQYLQIQAAMDRRRTELEALQEQEKEELVQEYNQYNQRFQERFQELQSGFLDLQREHLLQREQLEQERQEAIRNL